MAYGSNTEYREKELRDVYHYFFEGTDIPDNSEKLLDLFGKEVNPNIYDGVCSVRFDKGYIIIDQESEKEFYHDGSFQLRKIFTLKRISEEDYNLAREKAIFEMPLFLEYSRLWFENLEDFFFVKQNSCYERYDVYARNLFGLGFVRLTLKA